MSKIEEIIERIKKYWIQKEKDNDDPKIQFPLLWERAENCITYIEEICKKTEDIILPNQQINNSSRIF